MFGIAYNMVNLLSRRMKGWTNEFNKDLLMSDVESSKEIAFANALSIAYDTAGFGFEKH